jgi:T4 RnlA family RNA ligase
MNYQFPFINDISDVLPAIAGRDEFVVAEKEGYTVINYNVMMADTFPQIYGDGYNQAHGVDYDHEAKICRECRGIIFDSVTGEILRRPFHKFFNVNEREETQDHRIDLSEPHAILEKLDGSMIAPFMVNGEIIWGTKMGATDVAKPVEEFVKNNPVYADFALGLLTDLHTPIFEWCSRKQRIVLDYKEDQLILTGIRNIESGEYWTYTEMREYAELFGIPVVRAFEPQTDMKAFLDYVRDLEDLEGFIVRFDDGHMLKLKCHWYLQIHKAKEAILQDRNIVELILEEHLDDVKAHLPAEDRDRLTQFENEINHDIGDRVYMIHNDLTWLKEEGIDRKTFALEHASNYDQFTRAIMFKNFDVVDSTKLWADVCNTIRNNLTKTVKYEAIRDAWFSGVVYNV